MKITTEIVILLHERIIETSGGSKGIKDLSLIDLDSHLMCPLYWHKSSILLACMADLVCDLGTFIGYKWL